MSNKRQTNEKHAFPPHFCTKWTGTDIKETGAKAVCEALMSNTTLTKLEMGCMHTWLPFIMFFTVFDITTVTEFGEEGIQTLGKMLMTNRTLKQLEVNGKCKERTHISTSKCFICFYIMQLTGCRIQEKGAAALFEPLKTNTTMTNLNLYCVFKWLKRKRTHIHSQLTFHRINS